MAPSMKVLSNPCIDCEGRNSLSLGRLKQDVQEAVDQIPNSQRQVELSEVRSSSESLEFCVPTSISLPLIPAIHNFTLVMQHHHGFRLRNNSEQDLGTGNVCPRCSPPLPPGDLISPTAASSPGQVPPGTTG